MALALTKFDLSNSTNLRVIVAQMGARMHYAIPKMLHQAGMLEHFYTDICAVKGWPRALHTLPKFLQSTSLERLWGRAPTGLPRNKISAFTLFGWQYARLRSSIRSPSEATAIHLWAGKAFCELVLRQGFGNSTAIYTFNSAGLELLKAAKEQDIRAIVEQTIAPREIERNLVLKEQKMFPEWEQEFPSNRWDEEFAAREREEWDNADMILCGSEFVRDGIASASGPVERCAVIPYGVDVNYSLPERVPHDGPLRVLTVGAVGLRKGSPYVLEAAKQLKGKAIFRMVGTVRASPKVQNQLRKVLDLTGPIPRKDIFTQYAWADVFLLPSLCEGSATVVYEALAAGLPVVCTPNTGSVVRDGIDGFIVPIRDVGFIVDRLDLFFREPDLLKEMSQNARQRAAEFTLEDYSKRLIESLSAANSA